MIVKEWRDARWKFLIAAVLVLVMTLNLTPYEGLLKDEHPLPDARWAAYGLFLLHGTNGSVVIIPLAALLGASLISGEVSAGSIFLLFSKPASRSRLLLTKYGVCAGVLLAAALLGALLLVLVAAVLGYPVGSVVSFSGIALSAVLMWLGSLFVLGVALLASLLFRGVLASLVATALALFLIFALPAGLGDHLYLNTGHENLGRLLLEKGALNSYWFSERLYVGRGWLPSYWEPPYSSGGIQTHFLVNSLHYFSVSTLTRFLVSTIAAAVPLLAALWLFNKKAY